MATQATGFAQAAVAKRRASVVMAKTGPQRWRREPAVNVSKDAIVMPDCPLSIGPAETGLTPADGGGLTAMFRELYPDRQPYASEDTAMNAADRYGRARVLIALGLLALACAAKAELIWWDGSRDPAEGPPGKLLSDNEGYFGDCVLTGVEYTYETAPTNPPDVWREDAARFGRRLLDGRPSGNWWVPVGVNGTPLVVVLDFKRECEFREVDVCSRSRQVGIRVECADAAAGPWTVVFDRPRDQAPDSAFHRCVLPGPALGRLLRLSVDGGGTSYVDEVLVWGDAQVSEEAPEAFRPVVPPPLPSEIAFASIPGIAKTSFSDARFWDWQREMGSDARQAVLWSRVATWGSITDKPLLPPPAEVIGEVTITMARNETECVALALTNTCWEAPRTVDVRLTEFRGDDGTAARGLAGDLRVAGAIGSRNYGVNLGPLLAQENMPGGSLLRRYLTNGAGIASFPRITLSRAGSAVLWLSVTSRGPEPGRYVARLRASGGPSVLVRVKVLDVTLPSPPVWLNTWSGTTEVFPFEYGDRLSREVAYKQGLGITVWNGLPEPGTAAELAHRSGPAMFHVYGVPDKYIHGGYAGRIKPEELGEEDQRAIGEYVGAMVKRATELGLSYDDWYVELWDEPGQGNSPLYGALARMVRKADPNVRIYCNPCFWAGNGVQGDDVVSDALGPWYRECVDISVPLYLLLRDRPRSLALFDAPRHVRASYAVSTQSAKSESEAQVTLYRRMAWDAFCRGWNGWGFYSYYAPRGNPWDDTDASWIEDTPDYLMVYPGPRGPIGTRQSEAVREGWEDYCLLTLLRERGSDDELGDVLARYAAGERPEELRTRALEALAR